MQGTVHYETFKEKYVVQYGVKSLLQFLSINLILLAVKTLTCQKFYQGCKQCDGAGFKLTVLFY